MKRLVILPILALAAYAPNVQANEVLPGDACGSQAHIEPARAGVVTFQDGEDWYDASFQQGTREFTLRVTSPEFVNITLWKWDRATNSCEYTGQKVWCSAILNSCMENGGVSFTADEPGDYQLRVEGGFFVVGVAADYVVTAL